MKPAAMTIVLDDKRRHLGLWWQKLQHAVGGVPLLMAGVHRLQLPGGRGDVLALAEIALLLLVQLALQRSRATHRRLVGFRAPLFPGRALRIRVRAGEQRQSGQHGEDDAHGCA